MSQVETTIDAPMIQEQKEPGKSWWKGLKSSAEEVLVDSKLNVLLLFIPLALLFDVLGIDSATFVCSLLALVPLAERLGFVTEALAAHTNDTLGGLLNATFGNATELIICAVSLHKAGGDHNTTFLRIVQLSLLGSILGNLLFVLGTALLVGGLSRENQSFNREGMGVNSGMLIVAVVGIVLPSTLSMTHTTHDSDSALHLSRFESIIMLVLYALYLIFQLVTHRHLYEEPQQSNGYGPGTSDQNLLAHAVSVTTEIDTNTPRGEKQDHASLLTRQDTLSRKQTDYDSYTGGGVAELHRVRTMIRKESMNGHNSEEDSEEDMSIGWALFWLVIITALIAFLSEMVVGTIEDAHDSLGIPMPFLATIVLPIVGNAAEHASAILFAFKDRMEITLAVAVGSATQIAVLVIPFTVILAWIMGQPLGLDFEWFEAFTLFTCTMIMIISVNDGTSNWIKGLLLMVAYVIVAAAFWVHSDESLIEA